MADPPQDPPLNPLRCRTRCRKSLLQKDARHSSCTPSYQSSCWRVAGEGVSCTAGQLPGQVAHVQDMPAQYAWLSVPRITNTSDALKHERFVQVRSADGRVPDDLTAQTEPCWESNNSYCLPPTFPLHDQEGNQGKDCWLQAGAATVL